MTGHGATQPAALEPGLKAVLSLTLSSPAALAATLSSDAEDRHSSRPLDAGQEQQQRRKRRVEARVGSFGGSSAKSRREHRAAGACVSARAAREGSPALTP